MTTDNLTDIGPAPTPPAWCEPGTQPTWDSVTDEGGLIASWTRDIGNVWIACDDQIVDGRMLRSAPAIHYSEEPGQGQGISALAPTSSTPTARTAGRRAPKSTRTSSSWPTSTPCANSSTAASSPPPAS